MVEERLKELNIYYVRWKSGGDGEHFHLLFPEIDIQDILLLLVYLFYHLHLHEMI